MREKWIDNAKGIAILMVIIGHAGKGLQGFFNFDFFYGIHLVVFFLLSGYTLKKKDITRDYINTKFSRLMVPYFITCWAIIFADVINSGIQNHDFSIKTITSLISRDLLRSFFASGSITNFGTIELGTRIGAIWFLPALFFAIIIFQIVIKYCKEDYETMGIVLFVIAILGYISARFIWLPFSIQSGMVAAFFLYLGFVIKEKKLLQKTKWHYYIVALIVLCFGISSGYCYIGFVKADCVDLIISVVVGLAGCFIILSIAKIIKGRFFQWLGNKTMTILCVHLFALETMDYYFSMINDSLNTSGNTRIWTTVIINIFFAILGALIIEKMKFALLRPNRFLLNRWSNNKKNRDVSIDIVKGIFIILMIIGHLEIDTSLRNIIFSCHMIAFVFMSGYCYKKRAIGQSLMIMAKKLLLPYGLVIIGDLLLNTNQWSLVFFKQTILKYLLGMSFTKEVFSWSSSVGPVYFILLLFVVRALYMLLDKYIKKDMAKYMVTIGISLFGVFLGEKGIWLPWSIDVACYCLVFYMLGHLFHEKKLLQWVKTNHISYFLVSPVWVFMIFMGGMEIAIRKYGKYGVVIFGSIAGVLIVTKLAGYIADHLPILRCFLQKTGQATIIILMIHTLLRPIIGNNVAILVGEGGKYMIICTIIQVTLAIAIKWFIESIGRIKVVNSK